MGLQERLACAGTVQRPGSQAGPGARFEDSAFPSNQTADALPPAWQCICQSIRQPSPMSANYVYVPARGRERRAARRLCMPRIRTKGLYQKITHDVGGDGRWGAVPQGPPRRGRALAVGALSERPPPGARPFGPGGSPDDLPICQKPEVRPVWDLWCSTPAGSPCSRRDPGKRSRHFQPDCRRQPRADCPIVKTSNARRLAQLGLV